MIIFVVTNGSITLLYFRLGKKIKKFGIVLCVLQYFQGANFNLDTYSALVN